jgi:hypothetical protein
MYYSKFLFGEVRATLGRLMCRGHVCHLRSDKPEVLLYRRLERRPVAKIRRRLHQLPDCTGHLVVRCKSLNWL